MDPLQLFPAMALLLAGLIAFPAYAQDASNAGVSGEADFNVYCASCHGEDGKGNGPMAFGLSKPLPDLSTLSKRYGRFPSARLAKLIDGREPLAGHGDREMPVWGVWFKEEAAEELGGAEGDDGSVARRVYNLIGYIETLQAAP
jgi:mono/diheme cytochrome c family protein